MNDDVVKIVTHTGHKRNAKMGGQFQSRSCLEMSIHNANFIKSTPIYNMHTEATDVLRIFKNIPILTYIKHPDTMIQF
jgi:hypothetical protein